MATALLTHEDCLTHENPPGHPERVERLRALVELFGESRFASLHREAVPLAEDSPIIRAHTERYVEAICAVAPASGMVQLDGDTAMSPGSLTAVRRAVGAVMRGVDMVVAAECANAFCAVRPPGHHAERERAMGFCLFNCIAIGALHALDERGLERVAIVDFDVHHGNGTQDIFQAEPRVMYASTHQMPLYPGTGAAAETGVGNIVNAPLPPGAAGEEFRAAYQGTVLPRVREFAPDLLMISAGFDAHADDPLAQLQLREDDFEWVTQELLAVAAEHCGGKVVSVLEGGYDIGALTNSAAVHVTTLMHAGVRED